MRKRTYYDVEIIAKLEAEGRSLPWIAKNIFNKGRQTLKDWLERNTRKHDIKCDKCGSKLGAKYELLYPKESYKISKEVSKNG